MPHRRTPRGYVLNLLQRSADFDVKTSESINTVSADSIAVSLTQEFPGVNADAVLADEGLSSDCLINGLVLLDRHGDGALQRLPGPKRLSVSEFSLMQREEAEKQGRAQ